MCSSCQATQQIIAVLRVAHAVSAPHPACACCPHIHAYLLSSSAHGPHSRSPSHASASQHVTTCRACCSGAQWRPVISPFDCSVLPWRPIHPGQLKPTTLPSRWLARVSCCVGLSPTLSLPFSPARRGWQRQHVSAIVAVNAQGQSMKPSLFWHNKKVRGDMFLKATCPSSIKGTTEGWSS